MVDNKLYTVVCAGVRQGPFSERDALMRATALRAEWAETGINDGRGRKVDVYYRDGSLVATFFPYEGAR